MPSYAVVATLGPTGCRVFPKKNHMYENKPFSPTIGSLSVLLPYIWVVCGGGGGGGIYISTQYTTYSH